MYLKNEEDIGNKERYDFLKLFHIPYFSLKYDFCRTVSSETHFIFYLFIFWLCFKAYGILVPQPGTKPRPLAVRM